MATAGPGASSGGRWWGRSGGLPTELRAAYAESLGLPVGVRAPRILAWAQMPGGVCIGAPAQLSYGNAEHWTHIGWHEIERGGWKVETSTIRWTLYDGQQGMVELSEPGRLPELFRERVSASIVLEEVVPVRGRRGVIIAGRRDLSRIDAPIIWHTTLAPGLGWDTEGVRAVADASLAQLRAEYDIS